MMHRTIYVSSHIEAIINSYFSLSFTMYLHETTPDPLGFIKLRILKRNPRIGFVIIKENGMNLNLRKL